MRIRLFMVTVLASVAALSCSSTLEPRDDVTLLVTNSSCVPGPCQPQRVYAFPSGGPNTPGGGWRIELGTMSGPTLCVLLPASSEFRLIGPRENGVVDTARYVWTTATAAQLGVMVAVFPTATTPAFVAARAAGWSVSLPGTEAATAAPRCSPATPAPDP